MGTHRKDELRTIICDLEESVNCCDNINSKQIHRLQNRPIGTLHLYKLKLTKINIKRLKSRGSSLENQLSLR